MDVIEVKRAMQKEASRMQLLAWGFENSHKISALAGLLDLTSSEDTIHHLLRKLDEEVARFMSR